MLCNWVSLTYISRSHNLAMSIHGKVYFKLIVIILRSLKQLITMHSNCPWMHCDPVFLTYISCFIDFVIIIPDKVCFMQQC